MGCVILEIQDLGCFGGTTHEGLTLGHSKPYLKAQIGLPFLGWSYEEHPARTGNESIDEIGAFFGGEISIFVKCKCFHDGIYHVSWVCGMYHQTPDIVNRRIDAAV
jgi:hypothetical protein